MLMLPRGSMSEQQYSWLEALVMVALRQPVDDDHDDPLSLEMMEVTGVAGRLREYSREAANEVVAALFIFVLVFAWNYAKYSAKFGNSGPVFCKITAASIFGVLVCILHEIRARRASSPLDALCQIDHLPTVGTAVGQATANYSSCSAM